MIKVFEIILCMYLKTISLMWPVLHLYVLFIYILPICFDSAQVLYIYPAMTAFTNQYSLSNNFFDIGQL